MAFLLNPVAANMVPSVQKKLHIGFSDQEKSRKIGAKFVPSIQLGTLSEL